MPVHGGRGRLLVLATMGCAGLFAAVCIAGVAFGTTAPASSTTASSTPSNSLGALQPISDCIRQNRRAAVLFLVDETGSLHQTDPQDARVAGLQAALLGLNQLTGGEAAAQVDVEMTGFAVTTVERQPWTALNSQNLPGLQAQAQEFSARNNGFETDYYVALDQARSLLDQHAVAMNPTGATPVCKLMIWFTDGRLEIDNRTNKYEVEQYGSTVPWAPNIPLTSSQPGINIPATDQARQLICQAGGVADQMRADGIFSAVVPLETLIQPEDLQFLGAVAQGQDGAASCGTVGPTTASTGALIPGSDFNQLVLGFYSASVLTPPIPPGESSTGVCAPTAGACPTGTRTFVVDPSLSSFNVLALTQDANLNVQLFGPDGTSLAATRGAPGSGTVAGVQISWNWLSPTTLLLTGTLPPATANLWSGTWSVTFVDPTGQNAAAVNQVAIYLFGNLEAQVVPGTQLRKGRAGVLPIQLVNGTGTPQTSPVILKDVQVTATIQVAGQPAVPLQLSPTGLGTYVSDFLPAADLQASSADVHTELSITTPDGYVLPAVGNDSTVPLENPIGYPSVALGKAGVVYLSPIGALDQTAHGSFVLTAGIGATGCAWLAAAHDIKSPPGAGTVKYAISPGESQGQCLPFRPGSSHVVKVSATITGAATGEVSGSLDLILRNSIDGSTRKELIPVRFAVAVPVTLDAGTAIWLLLIGILGPLLLLYLLNLLARHFQSFDQLRYLICTVQVSGSADSVVVSHETELSTTNAAIFNRPSSLRNFECGGFDFSAHMPLSPFGAVTGRVSAAAQRVVTNIGLWRDGEQGLVPLGLGKMWALRVSPEDLRSALSEGGDLRAPAQATVLYLFNSEGAPAEQLEQLDEEARRQLPELLAVLFGKLPSPGSAVTSSGSGAAYAGQAPSPSGEALPNLPGEALPPLSGGGSAPLPDLSGAVGLPSDSMVDTDPGHDRGQDSQGTGDPAPASGSGDEDDQGLSLPPLPDL
jgi:hypothetical protein